MQNRVVDIYSERITVEGDLARVGEEHLVRKAYDNFENIFIQNASTIGIDIHSKICRKLLFTKTYSRRLCKDNTVESYTEFIIIEHYLCNITVAFDFKNIAVEDSLEDIGDDIAFRKIYSHEICLN